MIKKIAVLMILLILTINNTFSFASSTVVQNTGESLTDIQNATEPNNYNTLMEYGTTSTNGKKRQENVPVNTQSSENLFWGFKFICIIVLAIPWVAHNVLSEITSDGQESYTVQKVVSNHFDLFNIAFLVNSTGVDDSVDNILVPISSNVAIWFIGIRNLAVVTSIVILMYVALRMAVETISNKKARYKKMLFSWLQGIIMLFVIHIFMVAMIFMSNWLVEILNGIGKFDPTIATAEERIMSNISENLDDAHNSYGVIFYMMLYVLFAYYEFKFFVLYMGRTLKVAFYMIISPLVCVTIPLDKMGDNRAQAFGNWVLEFSIATFMQPMHLLIYMVTIFSVGEILVRNPLLGVAFLAAMSYAERTFKSVLKFKPNLGKGLKDVKLKPLVQGGGE